MGERAGGMREPGGYKNMQKYLLVSGNIKILFNFKKINRGK